MGICRAVLSFSSEKEEIKFEKMTTIKTDKKTISGVFLEKTNSNGTRPGSKGQWKSRLAASSIRQ